MKKFIILLLLLLIAPLSNTSIITEKKQGIQNDIISNCTIDHIDYSFDQIIPSISIDNSIETVSTIYSSDCYYKSTTIVDNNHSVINSIYTFYKDCMYINVKDMYNLTSTSKVLYTKTVGLYKVMNRVHFNLYLYHSINKLGIT